MFYALPLRFNNKNSVAVKLADMSKSTNFLENVNTCIVIRCISIENFNKTDVTFNFRSSVFVNRIKLNVSQMVMKS